LRGDLGFEKFEGGLLFDFGVFSLVALQTDLKNFWEKELEMPLFLYIKV